MTPTMQIGETVKEVRVRMANVPMPCPLQTSSGTVGIAPLVLIDLVMAVGIAGSAYLFCVTPATLRPIAEFVVNAAALIAGDALAPLSIHQKLHRRFRLLGTKGIAGMALAGLDMAAWDAFAKAQGLPLARALGGELRPVAAYNSCGLGMIGPERAAVEAQELLAPGFGAIKLRLGYAELREDIAVVESVRRAVGKEVALMCDYNQSLSVAEAGKRIAALDGADLVWIEEPIAADDYTGYARLRSRAATAIQIGENWCGVEEMARCLAAGACDFAMPDAMRIGGVTGWLRAASIAEAAGMPLSSHLFPEFSAHLLAISPTAHWLEYADWANPILRDPLAVVEGSVTAPDVPGSGVAWDEAAVARYLVS